MTRYTIRLRKTASHSVCAIILLLCFSLVPISMLGQDKSYSHNAQIIEIEAQLDTVQSAEERCLILVQYAHTLRWLSEFDLAFAMADSAHRMAERLDFFDGRVLVKQAYAHIYMKLGEYDKSLDYQRKELEMRETANEVDSLGLGVLYMSLSTTLQRNGQYNNALDSMQIALSILRTQDDPRSLAMTLGEIAVLYKKMDQPKEGLPYIDEAILILKGEFPHPGLAIFLNNKAQWMLKDEKYDEAKACVQEAKEYCISNGFTDFFGPLKSRSGQIAFAEGDYEKAISFFQEALNISESVADTLQILEDSFNISEAYLKNGEVEQAYQWGLKLEALLYRMQNEGFRADAYEHLAEVYELKGRSEKALSYMHKHVAAKAASDSLAEMSQARNLEARFRNGEQKISLLEKDKVLGQQAVEIELKNNRLKLLGFGAIALALLSALIVISYRQRIRSQAQAAELKLNQSLIESTEEERERIARELHDGTGSLLTGIKLGLEHLQEKMTEPEQAQQLSTTIYQVQTVAKEVRRVSHAMAPTAIERLPFEEVVNDLINAFSHIGKAEIDYSSSGDFEQMNKTERLMLYRIMQECLNNSFKHADASEITISLLATDGEIEMLFQDNGKGYDPSKTAKGLGLSSIEKRISYLHGKRTIETESGSGLLLIVNFPILRA